VFIGSKLKCTWSHSLRLAISIGLMAIMGYQLHGQSAFLTHGTQLIVGVDRRAQISLDGAWHYIPDAYGTALYNIKGSIRDDGYALNAKPRDIGEPIEYDFSKSPTLKVPADWNTQQEKLFRYEGPLWYEKDFTYQKHTDLRVFLHIGAANYRSVVWVNAQRVCQHEGGFTPFDCEVTSIIREGQNFVVIAVDSTRTASGVPGLRTDWYNYGGLTRDVSLVELPQNFIDDYELHLDRGANSEISGYVHVVGAGTNTDVQVALPELNLAVHAVCDADGLAHIYIHAPGLRLWSPEAPRIYQVRIAAGQDGLTDEIGFRTIEVRGTQILLNGKPIFLNGISIQAEAPMRTGRVSTDADVQTIFRWVHDLGANFIRLAHYPHDERMVRMADKAGVLVWSEIPNWQNIEFGSSGTLLQAKQQLDEMIRRDHNRASVILWSVANETPINSDRTEYLKILVDEAHHQDPTRPVTAALLARIDGLKRIVDDPLADSLDVIGVNEYIGWYQGVASDAEETQWVFSYDKPLLISEFGSEAKAGFHGSPSVRWTEESQADLYRHQLKMLNAIPQLRGLSPWVLMDFRSPTRNLPGLQDGFNRKGIVSEHGEKKLAFEVLAEAYKSHSIGHAQ